MQDARKLDVYRRSHALSVAIYRATRAFPRSELYGLTSQIRRCAVSIPSNIAEGCSRRSGADFGRFLEIAIGSAKELECQLSLARDVGYMPAGEHAPLDQELGSVTGMLLTLLGRVSSPERSGTSNVKPQASNSTK